MIYLLAVVLCLTQALASADHVNFNKTAFVQKHSQIPAGLHADYELNDIISWDGIALQSIVFDPTPVSDSGNPVVIFISSWGMNRFEYPPSARIR